MLKLKYDEKVHLDKWDIDVVPYITIENMEVIINDLLTCNHGLERDMKLMADVLVACTDIYDDKDAKYTYEEIMYSGLWDDILNACPHLKANIEKINAEVDDMLSLNRAAINMVNALTMKIQEVDLSKFDTKQMMKYIEVLSSKIGE